MSPCLVCGRPPVAAIPDGPVCRIHAIEFYGGLLAYASAQPRLPRESLKVTWERRVQAWRDAQTAA